MKALLLFLLFPTLAFSQKVEEFWDAMKKETSDNPRYYVSIVKRDSLFHREVVFLPEKTQAMTGDYLDEKAITPHGQVIEFHENKNVKSIFEYKNGLKHGKQLQFHENGTMMDTAYFQDGHQVGIRLQTSKDGWLIDSTHFDGAGNGSQFNWREDGSLYAAGLYIKDTVRFGKWKYFHINGKLIAEVNYVHGSVASQSCYDVNGKGLTEEECKTVEAMFPDNYMEILKNGVSKLIRPLNGKISPLGRLCIPISFKVNEDGTLSNFKAHSNYGNGLEEKAIALIKSAGPWKPARRFGMPIATNRLQPLIFSTSVRMNVH